MTSGCISYGTMNVGAAVLYILIIHIICFLFLFYLKMKSDIWFHIINALYIYAFCSA